MLAAFALVLATILLLEVCPTSLPSVEARVAIDGLVLWGAPFALVLATILLLAYVPQFL